MVCSIIVDDFHVLKLTCFLLYSIVSMLESE